MLIWNKFQFEIHFYNVDSTQRRHFTPLSFFPMPGLNQMQNSINYKISKNQA